MTDNIKLYERADTSDFQVVTVFSPRQEEYDEVMRQLMIYFRERKFDRDA